MLLVYYIISFDRIDDLGLLFMIITVMIMSLGFSLDKTFKYFRLDKISIFNGLIPGSAYTYILYSILFNIKSKKVKTFIIEFLVNSIQNLFIQ